MGMTGTQKNPFDLLVSKVLHSCKAFKRGRGTQTVT